MTVPNIPKTSEQLTGLLFGVITNKAYQIITIEARRKRLREADIARIEQSLLAELTDGSEYAHEFEGFEAEVAVAEARRVIATFFTTVRRVRVAEVSR